MILRLCWSSLDHSACFSSKKARISQQLFDFFEGLAAVDRFKRLASFRAIATYGSVTQAALHLHKVPSAVSYDLHALQRELGLTLLVKHGRGIRLTPQGEIFAEAVARAYRDFDRTLDRLHRPHVNDEPLRVCAVSGFGRYRLAPALLRALPESRPLELNLATAENVLRSVETGASTFGVSYKPLVSSTLIVTRIGEERVILIGPSSHRQPRRCDIAQLPFITYDEFEYVYTAWFRTHDIAVPERWNRLDHAQELEEAIEAVVAGRGYCIVPADAASRAIESGAARLCNASRRACRNPIYLLTPPSLRESEDALLISRAAEITSASD
jgi:DNA-binding transcriptional LysR family regulator